jgi:hypothetical protein
VYLENEVELVQATTTGDVVDGLEGTVGAKLLRRDAESRVVVNFHGVSLSFMFLSVMSSFLLLSSLCSQTLYGLLLSYCCCRIYRTFFLFPYLRIRHIRLVFEFSQIQSPSFLHTNTTHRTPATSPKAIALPPTAPSPESPIPTS